MGNNKDLFAKIGHSNSYLDRRERLLEEKRKREQEKLASENANKWAFHFTK